MSGRARELWKADAGAAAAEFALLVPLLLLFMFGIIDVGRYLYTINRAEKATQAGARYAVSTNMVPAGLASYSFVVDGGLQQGAAIPVSSFGGATCTSTGCTCDAGATCPPLGTADSTAFGRIVARMRAYLPEIAPENVVVAYGSSDLGYAGDPNGPDIAPLVTVRLVNLNFQPATLLLFGATLSLPEFPATLSLEDGAGPHAN